MNLPNWITICRILLVPFFVMTVLKFKQIGVDAFRYYAIAIFLAATITDALDGTIARIRKQKTYLGTLLDPIADKLLLLSSVILLSLPIRGLIRLPLWIPVTFISRDIILLLGAVMIYISNGKLHIKPNLLGKITTFFQMLTVMWILLLLPFPNLIWRIAGLTTIGSAVVYIYEGSRQLNKE